jgi:hypothetical protein
MKTLKWFSFLVAVAVLPAAYAQKGTLDKPSQPPTYRPPPPKDYVVDPPPPPLATLLKKPEPIYVYEQKPLAGRPVLITPEQAQTIIDRFKAAYPKLGSPRFLIYVNRELVNEQSGMKLVRRQERIESVHQLAYTNAEPATNEPATVKSVEKNTYVTDTKSPPTLADKQLVRDVERLFGRPLRAAGAMLADQKVAAQMIADKPIAELIGTTDTPQARKDREALAKIADAVIEVLISSKTMTVPTITSSQDITVPDIQATVICLSDAKILGQTSSSEVTARVPPATLASYDVREITEATALALLEDMMLNQ